jgi:cell division protein FtsL
MKLIHGIVLIFGSLFLSLLFFFAVFINLNIKAVKIENESLKKEIANLKTDIDRQKIEIARMTSPVKVVAYIEEHDMKPVKLKNIRWILVNE